MTHTVLIIILSAAVILLTLRILSFKKALRDIRRELELTRKSGYNRALTVTLFDKDLTDTASEINKNLDFQKKLKFDAELKERALKQSVSDIAHDLRTPLTVIKGNLSLLEDEVSFPDEALCRLSICSKKADSIRQMADSFFELALLESDGTAAVIERTDAAAALMQLIADNEAVIRQTSYFPKKAYSFLPTRPCSAAYLKICLQMYSATLRTPLPSGLTPTAVSAFQTLLREFIPTLHGYSTAPTAQVKKARGSVFTSSDFLPKNKAVPFMPKPTADSFSLSFV